MGGGGISGACGAHNGGIVRHYLPNDIVTRYNTGKNSRITYESHTNHIHLTARCYEHYNRVKQARNKKRGCREAVSFKML